MMRSRRSSLLSGTNVGSKNVASGLIRSSSSIMPGLLYSFASVSDAPQGASPDKCRGVNCNIWFSLEGCRGDETPGAGCFCAGPCRRERRKPFHFGHHQNGNARGSPLYQQRVILPCPTLQPLTARQHERKNTLRLLIVRRVGLPARSQ